MRGVIDLEGRSDDSGVEIYLSADSCDTAVFGLPAATTDAGGNFEVPDDGQNYRCMRAERPGFIAEEIDLPNTGGEQLRLKAGDINSDGKVDILDLVAVTTYFNGSEPKADLNGDGIVNIFDLIILANNYR